ncbi:hypothetical protein J3E69DRAFT_179767 [Trichoderma sp. SZMC 28015]
MNSTTPHSYDITNNTFGNNVRIHQGDIHNYDSHAPSQADPCLVDLRTTDPRDDKTRIEETKGNLLRDSYCWILEHADFRMWLNDPQCRLLWVKGDPGKGKTMLLCGIINELDKLKAYRLSYFFCQATETGLRSATAVLRGLIYSLVIQQPSLLSHVREKYDRAGKQLFEDRNAWTALSKILKSILDDPSLKDVVLLIDALDECTEGLLSLLHLIREISSTSYAKWIVSSRNWPSIEVELQNFEQSIRLCLELNEHSISAAVQNYVHYKVDLLAQKHGYNDIIQETIEKTLVSRADNTFLWVALVCQNLNNYRSGRILKDLESYPQGLDSLYARMLDQIPKSLDDKDVSLCKQVLTIVSTVYRPVTLHELHSLIRWPEEFTEGISSFTELIRLCGSFLAIRNDTIYFVHQSAKEYLTTDKVWSTISASSQSDIHYAIFSQSLQLMHNTLRRDIYCLGTPGYHVDQIQLYNPDPLIAVRYSCVYWIDHLCDGNIGHNMKDAKDALQEGGLVDMFLRHHFLHWLEALSLLHCMSEGVLAIARLTDLLEEQTPRNRVLSLVQDARRFIFRHKRVIESTPLQLYVSALIFSPLQSGIRSIFKDEEPPWMLLKPAVEAGWDACLQTLEGHSDLVHSIVFSPDGQRLASGSDDGTIKIWDVNSGSCQTLECYNSVLSIAFSPDGQQLASGLSDGVIKVWDIKESSFYLQTSESFNHQVNSVHFSRNGRFAFGLLNGIVGVWDMKSTYLQTFESHKKPVLSVVFSPNNQLLASGSSDDTIKVWDITSGACLQTLEGHKNSINSVIFCPNGHRLTSGSSDSTIRVWDIDSGVCLQTLEDHENSVNSVNSVVFSPDGQQLASGSEDGTVGIWDIESGTCLRTFKGNNLSINSVVFSPNGQQLASGSDDHTVRIWDVKSDDHLQSQEGHDDNVSSVIFSPNGQLLASDSYDDTVRVWDTKSGACLWILESSGPLQGGLTVFSPSSQLLATVSSDGTIEIWDVNSGDCLHIFYDSWPGGDIAFDATDDSHLITALEVLKFSTSIIKTPPDVSPADIGFHHYSISSDEIWIMKDNKPLIWLPPEYRSDVSAVFGATVAIGCLSGRVLIMRFSID